MLKKIPVDRAKLRPDINHSGTNFRISAFIPSGVVVGIWVVVDKVVTASGGLVVTSSVGLVVICPLVVGWVVLLSPGGVAEEGPPELLVDSCWIVDVVAVPFVLDNPAPFVVVGWAVEPLPDCGLAVVVLPPAPPPLVVPVLPAPAPLVVVLGLLVVVFTALPSAHKSLQYDIRRKRNMFRYSSATIAKIRVELT